MSSNVGLSTPRGSGTSGYVQRNLAHLKPRDHGKPYSTDFESMKHRQRQPDKEILEHDRKREIEVKVFELRDRLEDEDRPEEEIERETEKLRKQLLKESERSHGPDKKGLKMHQVHELAEAKIKQDNKFRSALGISKNYEEGSHWKRQEERLKKATDEEARSQSAAKS